MTKSIHILVSAILAVTAFTSQASAASVHVINDAWVLARVHIWVPDQPSQQRTLALGQQEKFEFPGDRVISVEVRYFGLIKSHYACGAKIRRDEKLTFRLEGTIFDVKCKQE